MLPVGIGAASLGIVVAWLTRIFLDRVSKFPLKVFLSLVSVLTGAASTQVGSIFSQSSDCVGGEIIAGIYFIGLLFGFITYPLLMRYEDLVRPRRR
jgi:hypothetical protein